MFLENLNDNDNFVVVLIRAQNGHQIVNYIQCKQQLITKSSIKVVNVEQHFMLFFNVKNLSH